MSKVVGDQDSYFYNASIKSATAVTKTLLCRFTTTNGKLDQNLITVCSNVLNIYSLEHHSIDLKINSPFNDKIIDCISVPIHSNPRAPRKREIDQALDGENPQPDYLFVLTQSFNCALVMYSPMGNRIDVVSRGCLSEKGNGDRRHAPFPIFVGQDSKFIALMLYDNMLKIVPIVSKHDSPFAILLSSAFNLRVRHSDVSDIIPLYNDRSESDPVFAVLYQRIEHSTVQGRSNKRVKRELEKCVYDLNKTDLVSKGEKLVFQSNSVYKVYPLVFGGFLACDLDQISYCNNDLMQPQIYRKLRTSLTITSICQVDEFDKQTNKTKEGHSFMRYLLATEAGELFMLAFQLDLLGKADLDQRFLVLEFLASELSTAASITYLDNNYVFYGSKNSDSYILEIKSELQPDLKRPFCRIVQTFESLSPIVDMALATPDQKQGGQSELLVSSGLNHSTFMSMVKKGIHLSQTFNFTKQFGLTLVQNIFSSGPYLFIKCFNYELPFCIKAGKQNESWESQDMPRSLVSKDPFLDFSILETLQQPLSTFDMEVDQQIPQPSEFFICSTTKNAKLFTKAWEIKQTLPGPFTLVKTHKQYFITVNQSQITSWKFDQNCQLQSHSSVTFACNVSAICINQKAGLLYVCQYDSPFNSVSVCDLENGMEVLHSQSLSQHVNINNMSVYFGKKTIIEDKVFNAGSEFSVDDSEVVMTTFQESCACLSIEQIQQGEEDHLICGFANGKILKLIYQIGSPVKQTLQEQLEHALNQHHQELLGLHVRNLPYQLPFHSPMVYYVGTILPKMTKVFSSTPESDAVIASSDKPVVFYKAKDQIEMQYLASGKLNSVQSVSDYLVFENENDELVIGRLNGLQRLQTHRMLFKKQITKSLIITQQESVVVLLEEPNLAFLDETTPAVNMVALVNKATFNVQNLLKLHKTELGNCIHLGQYEPVQHLIFVGTTYLKLDEVVPSSGRLLLLDSKTLGLVQEIKVEGSVQSVYFDGKCLVVAINNKIQIFAINLAKQQRDQPFIFELLDQKQFGTFIHSLTPLGQTSLIVADAAGFGIQTYDLIHQRGRTKLSEAASTHIIIWANQVVTISQTQFLVFDQSGNFFIFEKHPEPLSLESKFKLRLIGSFCVNEEVKSATFGSLRLAQKKRPFEQETITTQTVNKKKMIYQPLNTTAAVTQKQSDDVDMQSENEELVFDSKFELLIKTDLIYAKKIFERASAEVDDFSHQQIVYGTADGSIGTLFRLTPLCYYLLNLLQKTMDKVVSPDQTLISRADFRKVNFPSVDPNQQTVIDGDFLEQFLVFSRSKQLEVIRNMFTTQAKIDEQVTAIIVQLLTELSKIH